jgi:hypothetical protein
MSYANSNIFKIPNSYYRFSFRNRPEFSSVYFLPKFSFTRVNDKVLKIFVHLQEVNFNTNTSKLATAFSMNQNVSDLNEYIKKVQNSNFTDTFVNPALVLEKLIAAVQKVGMRTTKDAANSPISVEPATALTVTRGGSSEGFLIAVFSEIINSLTCNVSTVTISQTDSKTSYKLDNLETVPGPAPAPIFKGTDGTGNQFQFQVVKQNIEGVVQWIIQNVM